MSRREFVLTDVETAAFEPSFRVGPREAPDLPAGPDWSIARRTLRGGVSDGVDVIDLDNGRLAVSILPTRGMGLWKGTCGPIELGWRSPVRFPVHPAHVDQSGGHAIGWLSGFNEWLCRCGLSSMGPPGRDVVENADGSRTETPLTLHGRIANVPAHRVVAEVDSADGGRLAVTGTCDEASMFGPQLRLTATVETRPGSPTLTIRDRVTNLASRQAEVELLYHLNTGRPFLEAGSQCLAPVRELAPRDAQAVDGVDRWSTYLGPTPGYCEEVYFTQLHADDDHRTRALLRNATGTLGLSVAFDVRQLPWFVVWKNTIPEADGYVTGLEPALNLPNFKSVERRAGRLLLLEPGASHDFRLDVTVHATADEVAAATAEIDALQRGGAPIVHRNPVWS